MDIAFTVPGDDAESIAFTHLAGTVRYEHLDVYYQTAMPPVAGVSGSGIFDTSSLRFTVTSGALDHLQLERSTVDLLEFNTDGKYIVIDAAASGPLQSALKLPAAAGINVADSFSVDEDRYRSSDDTGQSQVSSHARCKLRGGDGLAQRGSLRLGDGKRAHRRPHLRHWELHQAAW